MVRSVKHQVIIGPGGAIEIRDPSLPSGSTAEVVIQFEQPELTPQQRVALLRQLQESIRLTPERAAKWIDDIKAEREAWHPAE